MEQLEIFPLPNPCIGVCQTNPKGYCISCFRSREERFMWYQMSQAQQQAVMRLCRARKARVKARLANTAKQEDSVIPMQSQWDF